MPSAKYSKAFIACEGSNVIINLLIVDKNDAIIPAKIIQDIPLPIFFSDIISPIQTVIIVPAVKIISIEIIELKE